jgi:U2 small nuclear ribonucleoprotein B''
LCNSDCRFFAKRVQYAKSKSYATLKREDPSFIPPTAPVASDRAKRQREDGMGGIAPPTKREKPIDEDEGEEMELDDDDEDNGPSVSSTSSCTYNVWLNIILLCSQSTAPAGAAPASTTKSKSSKKEKPSHRLLCTNLPQDATDYTLSSLFQP